ncbi:hypothetical protein [Spelaeicoccus albus]|uniref:Uncharacterized protein n=1 Tax=Spelaeicoccus albus TaxID=1280376 RepID=A0A7Z0ABB2_9MICO|nr:hypothetical protein [Spelaeicoccus albus]NYI66021.1 hypothetical protein [Spelaeicoccus albus]
MNQDATQYRVLVLGLDPATIPGIDADEINSALDAGLARFDESELSADQHLVPLDDSAESRVIEALSRESYDCVVVGGGIRKPEPLVEFFEEVINLIRQHLPDAAIAFNTDGGNSLEAARRVLHTAL